jgi:GNAT superfamily N-acetyltransferase
MWWRLHKRDFDRGLGSVNKRALKRLVVSGAEPGILAYVGDEPVGWLGLAPRIAYPRLERSRILAPVDDARVWSAVCFFVARPWRRRGVTVALLEAAVKYVRRRGGRVLEGYPVDPRRGRFPDAFAYYGAASAFCRAGFVEVARRSPTRPIMRYYLKRAARAVNASKGSHHAG